MLCTDSQFDLSAFFRDVADTSESALLVNYDGTLAPFQRARHLAVPYPGLTPILNEIIDTGRTRVVLITGRRAQEVMGRTRPSPAPEIWGLNGLERLHPDGMYEPPFVDPHAAEALCEADMWVVCLGLHRSVFVEHKPGCLAVHWRDMADHKARAVCNKILLGWLPIADGAGLTVEDFDGGIELCVADRTKADVVRTILSEMEIDAPIAYLGDNESDEDAFGVLRDRGLSVLVRPHWRETSADLWLRPPIGLSAFLHDWLQACQPERLGVIPMPWNLSHGQSSQRPQGA